MEEENLTTPEVDETEAQTDESTENSKKSKKSEKKSEIDALKEKNEELENEIKSIKDTHLRTLAEYDNFRKRSFKEKEAAYGNSKADVLEKLLPIIDNFDRAVDNKTEDIEVYRKGIEMIMNQFNVILTNLNVESFGEVGDEFDPNIHSAVMTIENDDLPENSIAAVFQKGYKMGDRILRVATVQVTK
ncbi:MAG: nucleotide exchange factor GrpE [Acutalibacteraceae bacterium]